MKDPLRKRWARELREDKGKYTALFLFLVLTIAFVSGFLVADNSMRAAYDESFEKYDVEDGHFSLAAKLPKELKKDIEKEGITVSKQFFKDEDMGKDRTVRVFKIRKKVNRACLMAGRLPEKRTEIAIDRLFAENNEIRIGDTIKTGEKKYKVVGTVALSDYSAMFKNNTDMMFNASKFSIALVTKAGFDRLPESDTVYQYVWTGNKGETAHENKVRDKLAESMLLTDFVKRKDNQAIMFTGDDMGTDKALMTVLLYVVMVILAFVFAVTTKSTIEQESRAIGTLRASGYTKGELIRHYLKLPVIVVLVAALIGNILGYTALKGVMASMYYHSYSLPTYKTLWNGNAFILTTLVPIAIILVVVSIILMRMLSLPPLQFLRRELTKKKKKGAVKLPKIGFIGRFRLRVILQNKGAYCILLIGIFLANLMMLFGLFLPPVLDKYAVDVKDSGVSKFQYVLKAPVETDTDGAEKYSVRTLRIEGREDVMAYGIEKKSAYMKGLKAPSEKNCVYISRSIHEKYNVDEGDTLKLKTNYGKKTYKLKVKGIYYYPAALAVFMSRDGYAKTFGTGREDFNGYFADSKLKDVDDDLIATTITMSDMTTIADQLQDSMGGLMPLFTAFATLIYVLLIYMLAKMIVDRNKGSIAMLKILGYTNREASKIYNEATAVVVIASIVISMPAALPAMHFLYGIFMSKINGWVSFYMAPWVTVAVPLIGVVCYGAIHMLLSGRVRKVDLAAALKDME